MEEKVLVKDPIYDEEAILVSSSREFGESYHIFDENEFLRIMVGNDSGIRYLQYRKKNTPIDCLIEKIDRDKSTSND